MKLLFAIKSVKGEGGGAERALVSVCNGLAKKGHDIQLLTFDPPGDDSFFPLEKSITRIDIDICAPGKPTPRLDLLLALVRIRKIVNTAGADLTIPFMHSMFVPLSLATFGTGAKLVFSEHTGTEHYQSRPIQRWLTKVADLLATAKTVPSNNLIHSRGGLFANEVRVIPNPIDLERLVPISRVTPNTPPIALSLGNLRAEKNHLDLIRAFARVAPKFPDWNLRILGEGELREELQAEIERLGMGLRISMPGVARDVAASYAEASLVVLPSLYESFGLVAAEALACGRPVLSFDSCRGVAQIVKNGENGILVPGAPSSAHRVNSLEQGLIHLFANPKKRRGMGEAGPPSVQRFDTAQVIKAWESFFLDVIK